MTTIAYRNGVLAGDRQTNNGGIVTGTTRKVWKEQGLLFGVAGSISALQNVMKWSKGKRKSLPFMSTLLSYSCIVVSKRGSIFVFSSEDKEGCILTTDIFALGSGGDLALGAMMHGASPKRSIELAGTRCVYTGGGIDVVRL